MMKKIRILALLFLIMNVESLFIADAHPNNGVVLVWTERDGDDIVIGIEIDELLDNINYVSIRSIDPRNDPFPSYRQPMGCKPIFEKVFKALPRITIDELPLDLEWRDCQSKTPWSKKDAIERRRLVVNETNETDIYVEYIYSESVGLEEIYKGNSLSILGFTILVCLLIVISKRFQRNKN